MLMISTLILSSNHKSVLDSPNFAYSKHRKIIVGIEFGSFQRE